MFGLHLILSVSLLTIVIGASEPVIILVGGSYVTKGTLYSTDSIEYYYPTKPYKNHVSSWRMRQNRSGLFALQYHNCDPTIIYGAGSDSGMPFKDPLALKSTEIFDPQKSEPPMVGPNLTKSRSIPSAAKIDDNLFVCSGLNKRDDALNSSEMYKMGKFVAGPDMPVKITPWIMPIKIAQFNGKVYAFDLKNKMVYIYSSGSGTWTSKPTTSSNPYRTYHSVAPSMDYIYICGGVEMEEVNIYKSCERYHPATNKWESIASMNVPRVAFVLVPDQGTRRLYAVGGVDFFRHQHYELVFNLTDSVEYFDINTGKWHMTHNLKLARSFHAAVLVHLP